MLREATRKLTGHVPSWPWDIRYGQHAKGGFAVTVDLRGWNDTRTFDDAAHLIQLGQELILAGNRLYEMQQQKEDGQ